MSLWAGIPIAGSRHGVRSTPPDQRAWRRRRPRPRSDLSPRRLDEGLERAGLAGEFDGREGREAAVARGDDADLELRGVYEGVAHDARAVGGGDGCHVGPGGGSIDGGVDSGSDSTLLCLYLCQ